MTKVPRLVTVIATCSLALGACTPVPSASPAASGAPTPSPAPTSSDSAGEPTAPPTWASAGRMAETRVEHSATLLQDGRVLVAGGFADGEANDVRASAELYDPKSGTWSRTGDMLQARAGHVAVLLTDGTVLVAAGGSSPVDSLDTAELFDPRTGSWSPTGKLRAPLTGGSATLLLDGRVLLAGGEVDGDAQVTAEIYDPTTRKWSFTGDMRAPRAGPTATRLWTGQVLLAGGADGTTPLSSAEIFDPATGAWSNAGTMAEPRGAHAAAILGDGRVLVAGGLRGGLGGDLEPEDILASAEVFDPVDRSWTPTDSMSAARFQFTLTALDDGTVLAAVGDHIGNGPVPGAERYDGSTGMWTDAGTMLQARAAQKAAMLADGDVLVVGGEGPGARGLASAETFDGPPPTILTLGTGGTVFPGTYRTAFEPPMTITIDHEVDLDCVAGYRCRGDIDVNLPQWVAFEFGNVHGPELDIYRLDELYAKGDGATRIAVPEDVAAWFEALPAVGILSGPIEVSVGGVAGARFDVRPSELVLFGPSGLPEIDDFGINGGANARARITLVRLDARLVVIAATLGPENTAGDFEAAVRGLDPIIASIVWE
jgi:Kelch motif protein